MPQPLLPEAVPFQDELEQLLAEPPPPLLRGPHYLAALLFLLLLLMAGLAKVDVVVTASGRLATDAPMIVLQPMERAVVRELLVKPGDLVTRGQVLATLDATFTEADRTQLLTQQQALRAQLQRLEAELTGQSLPVETSDNPHGLLQRTLYAQRQSLHAARLRALQGEISTLEATIRTLEDGAALQAEQLSVARDVESMRAQLLEGRVGSRLQYLGAQSQRLQTEQDYRQRRNRIVELQHSLGAKQAERQSFLDEWQRQLLEDLVRVRAEASRVEEGLAKTLRLGELLTLVAPRDGIVLELARRSIGSVLREAEPLITIVPTHVPLIAEIAVQSADIGYVQPDDEVTLKVDAFPYQRHGMLHGKLRAISQESFGRGGSALPTEEVGATPGGPTHRAQVELTRIQLGNLPEGARLIPGMTVTGEIHVGSRTVLSYFLDPLLRGFQEAVREP